MQHIDEDQWINFQGFAVKWPGCDTSNCSLKIDCFRLDEIQQNKAI